MATSHEAIVSRYLDRQDPRAPIWVALGGGLMAASAVVMALLGIVLPDPATPDTRLHATKASIGLRRPAVALQPMARMPPARPTPHAPRGAPPPPRLPISALRAVEGATTEASFTLYDLPVSNYGARIRLVLYWKGLEGLVKIQSPMDLGGFKTPEYLEIHPMGKIPALVLPDGHTLPESEVITQFLIDSFPDAGPQLTGRTPLQRAEVQLLTRYHDVYLGPALGAMYKAMPPLERQAGIRQIHQQLGVIEARVVGPFLTGPDPTTADAALFPTFVFFHWMLPAHFGWRTAFPGCPKLQDWFETMSKDPQGARVRAEVEGGLQAWEDKGRWDELGIAAQVKEAPAAYVPPFTAP